jgi:7,8-dihydropterin-6-yl-methyl-4-(beta-D-ribofuranosyl)aminobenzene 5'-phosphate synthase
MASRYGIRRGIPPREIGIPATARGAVEGARDEVIIWSDHTLQLAPGIGVTGPIPRETDYEDVGGPFFLDSLGERKDEIEDDQALWMSTPEGLIVFVGCSHAGLINTLNYARGLSGVSRLRAVIGGFHLLQADSRRLEMTVAALRSLGPELLVPCHCGGEKAIKFLKGALGKAISTCHVGAEYTFTQGAAGNE